jgi:hypothetical protein
MLRFAACDLGLGGGVEPKGGGGTEPEGGGPEALNRGPVGVTGADSSGGARRERTRIGVFAEGSEPKSIADAERGGPEAGNAREPLIPGEVV